MFCLVCFEQDHHVILSRIGVVIANEVKQSMTPEYMDCRAALAVTKSGSVIVCSSEPELVARDEEYLTGQGKW